MVAPSRIAVLLCVGLAGIAGARAAGAVALPDTGLFAAVAAQLRERLRAARDPARHRIGHVERLELLLESGQLDEAARLAARRPDDRPATTTGPRAGRARDPGLRTARTLVEG